MLYFFFGHYFSSQSIFSLPENHEQQVKLNQRLIKKNSKYIFYYLDVNRFFLNNILHKGLISREEVDIILNRGVSYYLIVFFFFKKKVINLLNYIYLFFFFR